MSHPPHVRSTWSSALIPLCGYKNYSNFAENTLFGVNLPFCSSFFPTMLGGQLCYKLSLNKTSGNGKKNGLKMLLDYNEDRSIQVSSIQGKQIMPAKAIFTYNDDFENKQDISAKILISTLSSFEGFGGGLYSMTSVKRMTSKKGFLRMDPKIRNCNIELHEDCRTRKLLEKCRCIPWEMPGYEVGILNNIIQICLSTAKLRVTEYMQIPHSGKIEHWKI